MTFPAGTRLGVYEITGLIGVGGMGEVYRATDTKLGREVAIKTLPSELASDRDRLARFEREAKLLATLNHAHIAAIYGLHEHAGAQFLAMELVEGETLERRLKSAPIAVEDAVRLALHIAEALEAAHEKDVVHRDLKPANVMVTRDGAAKVLDFGLAKTFSGDPNQTAVGNSPALSLAMTQAGLVLGTASYMSPEQASGQATDQRADVWAFGVVLYEMLTGLPLFSGESVPQILADVLKTEPDWSRLPKGLHPRLKLLLERCLVKKPRNRLHSIADARIEIEAILADPHGMTRAGDTAARGGNGSRLLRVAGAVCVAGVVAGAAGWFLRPVPVPEPGPVVRFSLPLPPEQSFTTNPVSLIAVARDGARIVYATSGRLYLRDVGEPGGRFVDLGVQPGVGALTPVFSPDGQWLAYIHAVGPNGPWLLKRVPINGGAPVTIHNADGDGNFPQGLTWPTPDTMMFADAEGIVRIRADSGAKEILVARGDDERFYSPQLLPAGDAVLFTRARGEPGTRGGFDSAQIVVQSVGRKNDRTVVWDGGSTGRYLPSGHLVYAKGTALFAIPFDPNTRAARGESVELAQGLRRSVDGFTDTANFAVSDTGTLATIPSAGQGRLETTLTWVDREGREVAPFPVRPDDYTHARVSPDGSKVVLVVNGRLQGATRAAIWIFDQQTENSSLLTADPSGDDAPVWSSDSSRVFFRSNRRNNTTGVYAIDLDSREATLVWASPDHPFALPWTISPDDRTLGIIDPESFTNFNIGTLSLADSEFALLLRAAASETEPSISPNGAWIAHAGATTSPDSEITIDPFPDVSRGGRVRVARGYSPVFSRNGSELFFFDGGGLSVAPIFYEPTFRVGEPRRLFPSSGYLWHAAGRSWDADPSGQRFLMIREPGTADAERIDVVVNWFEELKNRVPVQ